MAATLVDLKRTKADKAAEKKDWQTGYTGEDYPWGLRITLGDEELAKLGNPQFDMENGGKLTAEFFVCSESARTVNGETKREATLELRKIAIDAAPASTDNAAKASKLYGEPAKAKA